MPDAVKGNDDGQAFFGLLEGSLTTQAGEPVERDDTAQVALDVIGIIKTHLIDRPVIVIGNVVVLMYLPIFELAGSIQ